jgi:c-di-GMP-binding flagellar brake protein YcgR
MSFLRKFKPFDRRKDARLDAEHPIKCFCTYREGERETECLFHVLNISRGGIFVASDAKILPGTQVQIRFQLPSHLEGVSVQGEIVRTYRRSAHGSYYSGIKFKNKGEEAVKLLFNFVLGRKG